jgi:hypothetical protein
MELDEFANSLEESLKSVTFEQSENSFEVVLLMWLLKRDKEAFEKANTVKLTNILGDLFKKKVVKHTTGLSSKKLYDDELLTTRKSESSELRNKRRRIQQL